MGQPPKTRDFFAVSFTRTSRIDEYTFHQETNDALDVLVHSTFEWKGGERERGRKKEVEKVRKRGRAKERDRRTERERKIESEQ